MVRPVGTLPTPSLWVGRSVFLTGHTGFKGSWLMAWLRRMGADVTGFSLAAEPGNLGEILGHNQDGIGDIRDAKALQTAMRAAAPCVVFHLAAQALVRQSYQQPLETFETNVMGTANLLEAVRATPSVRAVVVVTSDKCYENREWSWPYRETDALGGHDPYSASKAGAELVTAAWRRSFLSHRSVAVASARAGNVVGGGDWSTDRLVPDCVRAFAAGRRVSIRNPRATRPWQHVLDPLCGYMVLAERLLAGEAVGEAWNFGPDVGDVLPVTDVVGIFAAAWGGGAAWTVDPGEHPHEAGSLAVDTSQARTRLGWRPRLTLHKGLQMAARWYRQQLDGEDPYRLLHNDVETFCGSCGE